MKIKGYNNKSLKMNRFILVILLITPIQLAANTNKTKYNNLKATTIPIIKNETIPKIFSRRINISLGLQEMYSTHGTYFSGIDGVLNYPLSPSFFVGLGVEYTHSRFHPDNGWNLTKINFIPVFIDSKLNLAKTRKFTPFAHLSTGVTFKNYRKVWSDHPDPSYASRYKDPPTGVYNISEEGWYMYSGIGISYKISNKLSTYIDVGIKAFHMSWNPWQINPRGLTAKLGITL